MIWMHRLPESLYLQVRHRAGMDRIYFGCSKTDGLKTDQKVYAKKEKGQRKDRKRSRK